MRGSFWLASLHPGITSKEEITQKSPIKGQACWAIAQRREDITGKVGNSMSVNSGYCK